MRKTLINTLCLLAMFSIATLQSCQEDVPPVLTVSSTSEGYTDGNFAGAVGSTLELTINVEAEDGFSDIRISKSTGDELFTEAATEDGQTSYTTTFTYTVLAEDVDAGNSITITVTDDNENSDSKVISLDASKAPVDATRFSARLLYAPSAERDSETFLSTDNGMTYTRKDVEDTPDPISPMIDFGYYFGNTNKASLASPAEYPTAISDLSSWGTKNNTLLKLTTMPATHVQGIVTNDDIMTHYAMTDMSDAEGVVTQLSVDQTIAFQLDSRKGSRKGFIYVRNIKEGFGSEDYIEIDVVIETAE